MFGEDYFKLDEALINPLLNRASHENPAIIDRGEGVWLYTVDGKKILDGFSSLWNVNIGYGREEIARVAYEQIKQLAYVSSFSGISNVPAINLANKLSQYAYKNLKHTFFTSGGSEANESAFKTVRYYWKRKGKPKKTKIIALKDGFHGFTMACCSATGIEKFSNLFDPKVEGFLHIHTPYEYRYAGTIKPGESIGQAAASELEKRILDEGADNIGGFIIEPVLGVGGGIIPPDDYMPLVREICDRYEVLLISDEVITGFGRTGKLFGLHHWGIEPDILVFAKGITSGYLPLGGIQVSDDIYNTIIEAEPDKAWLHGYTYSGHAAACAVALKNIQILEEENLLDNVNRMGQIMLSALQEFECEFPNIADVRGKGLMLAFEVVKSKESKERDAARASWIYHKCLERGVRLRTLGNIIALSPPFIINETEAGIILDTLKGVLKESMD